MQHKFTILCFFRNSSSLLRGQRGGCISPKIATTSPCMSEGRIFYFLHCTVDKNHIILQWGRPNCKSSQPLAIVAESASCANRTQWINPPQLGGLLCLSVVLVPARMTEDILPSSPSPLASWSWFTLGTCEMNDPTNAEIIPPHSPTFSRWCIMFITWSSKTWTSTKPTFIVVNQSYKINRNRTWPISRRI